jgi:hypothetical protein
MASIAMMAGGALINALAFSGTNFLFSQFGDHGEEMKRHNLAMEQLSKARDEFNKQREQRLDFINTTLRDQRHAEQTFSDLGVAMQQYYKVTGQQLPPLGKEPKLSDFYNPSRNQKDTELILVAGGMIIAGVLAYKYS